MLLQYHVAQHYAGHRRSLKGGRQNIGVSRTSIPKEYGRGVTKLGVAVRSQQSL